MGMNVERNNSGFLFKNDRKEKETHSDYQGTVNIDGNQMWINGWIKTGKDGSKYLSLSFKDKETRARPEKPLKVVGGKETSFDDDPSDSIPF